jgi:hypothetical protein
LLTLCSLTRIVFFSGDLILAILNVLYTLRYNIIEITY